MNSYHLAGVQTRQLCQVESRRMQTRTGMVTDRGGGH
jgi:hypothetical protein